VNISSSVYFIDSASFYGCTNLESINVDEDNNYFKDIDGVLFDIDEATLLQFPCGKNDTYSIPNGVSTIGAYAFGECTDLKNVSIPSAVTTIEESAFSECTSLTSITIPASVTSVVSPFSGCIRLASIHVDEDNPSYADIDGVLFDHSKTTLVQYPCGYNNTYRVPDGVTSIGEYSFIECNGLTSVTIPASVTLIGDYAFNLVNMAYINYLGSVEPTYTDPETTFVVVDVVCVPMNYSAETFCGRYKVNVESCEEFVAQHNQCYEVLEWQAEEITVKKRANATLWEKKTNKCFEYQCLNTSGRVAWSKCNSSGDDHMICIDNQCLLENEAKKKDKWGVEVSINIAPNDYDIDELTTILVNVTEKPEETLIIGTESTDTTGYVIRIVVYVDDEDSAKILAKVVEDNQGKGEKECAYGVLCRAKGVNILPTPTSASSVPTPMSVSASSIPKSVVSLSGTYSIHYNHINILVVIIVSVLLMVYIQ